MVPRSSITFGNTADLVPLPKSKLVKSRGAFAMGSVFYVSMAIPFTGWLLGLYWVESCASHRYLSGFSKKKGLFANSRVPGMSSVSASHSFMFLGNGCTSASVLYLFSLT